VAEVSLENAPLQGALLGKTAPGDIAVVAIRPDDLTPRSQGPIHARVVSAEYRGRDFYGIAATAGGQDLFFRSDRKVEAGEELMLGADQARVLIYPNEATPVKS
jgi:putative spermidine/putrescine transport system ATP-binding protein